MWLQFVIGGVQYVHTQWLGGRYLCQLLRLRLACVYLHFGHVEIKKQLLNVVILCSARFVSDAQINCYINSNLVHHNIDTDIDLAVCQIQTTLQG